MQMFLDDLLQGRNSSNEECKFGLHFVFSSIVIWIMQWQIGRMSLKMLPPFRPLTGFYGDGQYCLMFLEHIIYAKVQQKIL